MKRFKQIYKDIQRLQSVDVERNQANSTLHLAKALEELGELAQSVNKLNGRKKIKASDTPESIQENILEEGVDTIQCVLSLLADKGFTYDQIKAEMDKKNLSWAQSMGIMKFK